MTKLLVEAGADLKAKTSTFPTGCTNHCTPLYMAADTGHPDTMKVLIEAGANLNSRALDGTTSLYKTAYI